MDSWNPLRNNISQWFSWLMPILMPIFLALLFLSFLLCIITNCTSRDINLSKTARKRPHPGCHRSLRILPHTTLPASRKQLKRLMLHPNS
jgi:hypothetical protein